MESEESVKSILVCQVEEINLDSKPIVAISKPQVITMNSYEIHLLFNKINFNTVIYYVERFQIDYLALNIPITKYIKTGQHLISCLKQVNHHIRVICTGEAITPEIAKDIGADAFTKDGDDFIRVLESLDKI